jgi:hypothetical protein
VKACEKVAWRWIIAVALNAAHAKRRAGERWYPTSVYRILKAADAL